MIILSSCGGFSAGAVGENSKGINMCVANVNSFSFKDETLNSMSRSNKENAVQINCLLYRHCGYKIQNPQVCDQ